MKQAIPCTQLRPLSAQAPASPQQSAKKAARAKALGSKDDLFGTGTAKARRAASHTLVVCACCDCPESNPHPVAFTPTAALVCRRRLDGLPVYSAEELRVDQGGGTLECPFDCDCCF